MGHDGTGGTGQQTLPFLGQQDSFLIPSGGETATHTLLHWAVSDSRSRQGQGLWEILQSLQEAGVEKDRQQDENYL